MASPHFRRPYPKVVSGNMRKSLPLDRPSLIREYGAIMSGAKNQFLLTQAEEIAWGRATTPSVCSIQKRLNPA
jgi:hypothetical protein